MFSSSIRARASSGWTGALRQSAAPAFRNAARVAGGAVGWPGGGLQVEPLSADGVLSLDAGRLAFLGHSQGGLTGAPFVAGALRVSTQVKIDDRRDRPHSIEGKVRSVREKL